MFCNFLYLYSIMVIGLIAYGKEGYMEDDGKGRDNVRHLSLEDMAMKTAAQFFSEELLPYLGIKEKNLEVAPTELVRLETRHLYQDFNYAAEKGRWIHLEFESDTVTIEDLKRFREYEATTSRTFHVAVTTYVICSARARNPVSQFTEGINTYRVKLVQIKDRDADALFRKLSRRVERGKDLRKKDLVSMLLTPLMSGEMPQKTRIIKGIQTLNNEKSSVDQEEKNRMQAVLYALASKFLGKEELEEVKEVIAMTLLGQMLVEDGKEMGKKLGKELGRQEGIQILIETCREFGISRADACQKVIEKFHLPSEEAEEFMKRYWLQ
jgi:hypothetical protein